MSQRNPFVTPADSELIARVLAVDDRAAFGELVVRHQSAVRGFLRHLTKGDAALADDLAQETFIRAYRGLDRFAGSASFSTWLLGIAHNQHRNAQRLRWSSRRASSESDAEIAVESSARLSDLQHDLSQALQRLNSEEQTALHLHYHQGLSHGEMAAVLSRPVGTIKTILLRSKTKLRELLSAWNPQT